MLADWPSGPGILHLISDSECGFPKREPAFLGVLYLRVCVCAKLLQSCLTLGEPMDCGPPGSSVQARIPEGVAMPSARGASQLRDRTCDCYVSCIDRKALYH